MGKKTGKKERLTGKIYLHIMQLTYILKGGN